MGQGTYSEQLAKGVTEGLTEHFSRFPDLFIRSDNTVYSYKRRQHSPQTIGRSLGVERLLIGDVAVDDTGLRVNVQLLDVGTGDSIWTHTYRVKSSEVLTIQRRITSDVMRELGVVVKPEELIRSTDYYPTNEEAYWDYMMGRYFFNKRTKDDFHRGIESLRLAIEKDPSYALAYAGLADCYNLLGAYIVMDADKAFTSAREAATKALELDDGHMEGVVSKNTQGPWGEL
jgi:TolB-like protein